MHEDGLIGRRVLEIDLSASLLHLFGPTGLEVFVQEENLLFARLPTHDVTRRVKPDFTRSKRIGHDRYAKPRQRFLRANRTLHWEQDFRFGHDTTLR
jgi:hypothetical protein